MTVLKESRNGIFNSVNYEKKFAALRFEHAFDDAVIEKDEQLVVEAINIEQKNGFRVELQGVPGKDLEEFFKRTEAPGKRDEGIGFFSNERLACVHGAGDMKFRDSVMRYFQVNEDFGNYADDYATLEQRCFCNCLHEADV